MPAAMGRDVGAELARALDHLTPQVAALLGVPPDRPVTVRLREEFLFDADGDMTDGAVEGGSNPAIHLGSRALAPGMREYVLAHELVHWYVRGRGWDLPYLIEEALAEFVGLLFGPRGFLAARIAEIEDAGIEPDPAVLKLDSEDLRGMNEEDQRRACLSAFALAQIIGFDRLPVLAAEGKGSAADLAALL